MSHNITVVFLIISWLVYILFISFISLLIFDDEMPYWNLIWMIWTYGGREHPTSMQDVLQSAKAETAQVKRIVLSCERDMEAQKGMKNTPEKSRSRKGIYINLYNYITCYCVVWDHLWDV